MKKFTLVLAMLLLSTASYAATQGLSGGTITFSGRIVEPQTGQQLTNITTEQTADAQGNPETLYVVSSAVTGDELATFTTEQAAETYASTVTVQVAYR
jgi:type 1 fimbria pilin